MAIRVQDLPEHDRPRERLWSEGVGVLADRELLALLLRNGCNGKNAIDVAAQLLIEHEGPGGLALAAPEELARASGVGTAKAATVAAAFELGRRARRGPGDGRKAVREPADLVEIVLPLLASRRREEALVVVLDGRHRVIRVVRIGLGSAKLCLLPVREVLNTVLRNDGEAFAVSHNHPSGDPAPSRQDLQITEQISEAARVTGLDFIDHVIVGDRSWTSFGELESLQL